MSAQGMTLLRERFEIADGLFRQRAPRERILIAAMIVALFGFAFDSFVLSPLEQSRSRSRALLRSREEAVAQLEGKIESVRHPVLSEAERARRDELRQLEQQIAEIDEGVRGAVSRLVPPESAVEVLEELLAHGGRLKLVALTSQPPRRLGPEETQGTSTLYQHGLRLEIEGDFAATLDYLRRIEGSSWQLLWDRFDYQVDAFPAARVTIELHTLSEREEWVGV